MNTQEVIQNLRKRPDLIRVMQELNREIEEERNKRQAFYELIHEDVQAEFINGEVILHAPVKRKHWKIVNKLAAYLTTFVE